MHKTKTMDIERFRFDKKEFSISTMLPKDILDRVPGWELERYLSYEMNAVVYRLRNIMIHGHKEKDSIRVPVTWIDAFKAEVIVPRRFKFFFSWLHKRMKPIKWKTITTENHVRFCPHFRSPDNSPHIEFLSFKNPDYLEIHRGENFDTR